MAINLCVVMPDAKFKKFTQYSAHCQLARFASPSVRAFDGDEEEDNFHIIFILIEPNAICTQIPMQLRGWVMWLHCKLIHSLKYKQNRMSNSLGFCYVFDFGWVLLLCFEIDANLLYSMQ